MLLGIITTPENRRESVVVLNAVGAILILKLIIKPILISALSWNNPSTPQKWIITLILSMKPVSIAKLYFAMLIVLYTERQRNFSSAAALANNFAEFFETKIIDIQNQIKVHLTPDLFCTFDSPSLKCQLINFSPTSTDELSKIAHKIVLKSCILEWHFCDCILFSKIFQSSNLIHWLWLMQKGVAKLEEGCFSVPHNRLEWRTMLKSICWCMCPWK